MSVVKYVQRFFDWWLAGLSALIPATVRKKIFQYPDQLVVEFDQQAITFSYYNGNTDELEDKKTIQRSDELEKADIKQWLAARKSDNLECIVLASRQHILNKSLSLPLSAETDLREIVGFEMDRQTPFSLDQVYYDTYITSRDSAHDKLQVELFVATREHIDALLTEIRAWSLSATSISFRDNNTPMAINLLPREARAVLSNRPDPLTLAAGAGALVLLIAALYLPVLQQQKLITVLEAEVEQSRVLAREVQPLITEREQLLERSGFLAEQRRRKLPVIKILAELTNILPDDTFLERLTIHDNEIQINGESDSATSIIQLLEKSDYLQNTQPRSPVTKNNATNKEKFHVSAILVGQTD